jgi:putative CocE/NonD family hydrolase
MNLTTRYDSVNVPILHVGGWHDIFIQGILNAFTGIQEHGGPAAAGDQNLIVGPWTHAIVSDQCGELSFPGSQAIDLVTLTVDWFDRWLKGADNSINSLPAIQYYMMGDADQPEGPGNRWINADAWPPPAEETRFHLRGGGALTLESPFATESPDSFLFDPEDPVPTIGGRNLPENDIPAGSYDQGSVESRPDVLVYTTDPLMDSLAVAGRVRVDLWVSSDGLDTDFTAKLCDVYPDGRSMLVADGIIQARHRLSLETETFLVPGEVTGMSVDLWSTAVVFAPGHRIRLSVSSSNHPRFEVNPNTGEPFRKNTTFRTAVQAVYHSQANPSALVLPVVRNTGVVSHDPDVPSGFRWLDPNFPNPFNASTVVGIQLPARYSSGVGSSVSADLQIVDLLGRVMARRTYLLEGSERYVRMVWDGKDLSGDSVPSGIYFIRIRSGQHAESRKMTLIR